MEGGGTYLGICAGAYFASREVIFEKGTPLEVHLELEEEESLEPAVRLSAHAVYPDRRERIFSEGGLEHASVASIAVESEVPHYIYVARDRIGLVSERQLTGTLELRAGLSE